MFFLYCGVSFNASHGGSDKNWSVVHESQRGFQCKTSYQLKAWIRYNCLKEIQPRKINCSKDYYTKIFTDVNSFKTFCADSYTKAGSKASYISHLFCMYHVLFLPIMILNNIGINL